ncbi:MAG: type IV secretory system conjugative DNA transfer family protein [Mesorhizobium sp.]
MQLPPDDEIVMVAGIPPIRAKKARYFEDARFRERLLPVPENPNAGFSPRPDDWSALKPLAPPVATNSSVRRAHRRRQCSRTAPPSRTTIPPMPDCAVNPASNRTRTSRRRRSCSPSTSSTQTATSQNARFANNRALARNMRQMARQISLNPGDGMEL